MARKNKLNQGDNQIMDKDQILDQMRGGKFSRRRFNQLLAGTGLSLVTIPVFDKPARADARCLLVLNPI